MPRVHHEETALLRRFIDALRETLDMDPLYRPKDLKSEEERFYVPEYTDSASPEVMRSV